MTAVDSFSGLIYPRSQAPADLYAGIRTLVDQMRRVRADDFATQREVEDQANAIGATLKAEIEANQLSPDEAFNLMMDAISASVFGSAQASANATWAEANALWAARLRAALQTYVQTASINVEQTVRQSATESLTSQVTTLDAALGTTNANLTLEQTARSTGDAANATTISTVQTQVNGNTASIGTLQTSVDGIEARWGVSIDINGHVTGLVQLDGSASGSTFTIAADKLVYVIPGTTTVIPVLVSGLVGGTPTTALNGNVLIDGSVLTRTIAANAITTNKLAAGAVTATEIASNAVTADKISAGSVTADKISAGSVTASKIAAGAVTANDISTGTLTAVLIQSTSGASYWNLATGDFQIGA